MESRPLALALAAALLAAPATAAQQGANQIAGPVGPPDDPFEDNATCATAQPLVPGAYEGLVVGSGSPDHFRVAVPAQSALELNVVVRSYSPDFTLRVLGACDDDPQLFDGAMLGTRVFVLQNPTDQPSERVLLFSRGTAVYGYDGVVEYDLSVSALGESIYPDLCDGGPFADCPCGNVGEEGTGCEHSGGYGARLVVGGSQLSVLGGLGLRAELLPPGAPAMLFSSELDGPPSVWPFQDGLLCHGGGGIVRHGAAVADVNGLAKWPPHGIDLSAGRAPGQELAVQVWYRDGTVSVCGTGSNTTQAKRVFVQP